MASSSFMRAFLAMSSARRASLSISRVHILLGLFREALLKGGQVFLQRFQVEAVRPVLPPGELLLQAFENLFHLLPEKIRVLQLLEVVGQEVQEGVGDLLRLFPFFGRAAAVVPNVQMQGARGAELRAGDRIVVPRLDPVGNPLARRQSQPGEVPLEGLGPMDRRLAELFRVRDFSRPLV